MKAEQRIFIFFLTISLAAGLVISGCGLKQQLEPLFKPAQSLTPMPTSTPTLTRTPAPTLTPTITPLPQLTIRVMAYNLWLGGGMEAGHAERMGNMNRLDDLIALVKQANPDLLGLEEANGWESGNPSVIERFAEALNMNYYLAPTWRGFNLAILSKFPILETENLSEYVGNNGALRAVVQTPDGKKLNVVVVHLDPTDMPLRSCEFDKLRRTMESYSDQPGILMGDINTYPFMGDAQYLTKGGWEIAQSETIDNIFIFSRRAWSAQGICFSTDPTTPGCALDPKISDHKPVGAAISLYDFPNSAGILTAPAPIPTVSPELPKIVSTALKGVKVIQTESYDPNSPCSKSAIQKSVENKQAALLHFRITGHNDGSKFDIYFDNGKPGQGDYRRYGVVAGGPKPMFGSYIIHGMNNSTVPSQSAPLTLLPDQWYYLLLAVDKDGAFRTVVWNPNSPSQLFEVTQPPNSDWARDSWQLGIRIYSVQLEINEFQLLSFDGFQ